MVLAKTCLSAVAMNDRPWRHAAGHHERRTQDHRVSARVPIACCHSHQGTGRGHVALVPARSSRGGAGVPARTGSRDRRSRPAGGGGGGPGSAFPGVRSKGDRLRSVGCCRTGARCCRRVRGCRAVAVFPGVVQVVDPRCSDQDLDASHPRCGAGRGSMGDGGVDVRPSSSLSDVGRRLDGGARRPGLSCGEFLTSPVGAGAASCPPRRWRAELGRVRSLHFELRPRLS